MTDTKAEIPNLKCLRGFHEPALDDFGKPASPYASIYVLEGVNICCNCGVLYVNRTILDKIKEERKCANVGTHRNSG